MPEAGLNKIEINWSLFDLDHATEWIPQFPIFDVAEAVGGVLAEQPRFGFQDAVTNWQRGKTKTITFSTTLFARDYTEGEAVQEKREALEALAVLDEELGRPPICLFTLGTAIEETCVVEGIDPTIVDTLRDDGLPREIRFHITLRRYVPFSQSQIDPTQPAKESFLLVASAAEQSYEAIARRYYGDPMLGDRLRKRNPSYPFAAAVGTIVKVPAKSIVLQEVVEPEAHMLSLDDTDAVSNYERILEDRSARTLTEVR